MALKLFLKHKTYKKLIRDDVHMTSMKIVQFSRPPPPLFPPIPHLSIYVQNSSTSLTLDVQFQTNPRPDTPYLPAFLQIIANQLKENIIQERLLYVIRSFLQVGFRFQYQLINLVWLSLDFFLFSWSLPICFFVVLYSYV